MQTLPQPEYQRAVGQCRACGKAVRSDAELVECNKAECGTRFRCGMLEARINQMKTPTYIHTRDARARLTVLRSRSINPTDRAARFVCLAVPRSKRNQRQLSAQAPLAKLLHNCGRSAGCYCILRGLFVEHSSSSAKVKPPILQCRQSPYPGFIPRFRTRPEECYCWT